MSDIICRDTLGRNMNYLTQWDMNRVAVINGITLSPAPRVRFSNKASKVSLVVKPKIEDSSMFVDIPNILLQQPHPIVVSVFYEYSDGILQTEHVFTIPVIPHAMPDDYFFVDNVKYTSWAEVQERAELLMHDLELDRNWKIIRIGEAEPQDSDIIWFDTSNKINIQEVSA